MGKISNFFFKRKLAKLGFDMSEGSEDERIKNLFERIIIDNFRNEKPIKVEDL